MSESNELSHTAQRALVGVALPVVAVAAALGTLLANRASLPPTLVTHWDVSGQPNGTMSLPAFAILVTAATVIPGTVMATLVWRPHPARHEISAPMGLLAFFVYLWAAMTVIVVRTNLDAAMTGPAQMGPGEALIVVVVALLAGGSASALTRFLESDRPGDTNDDSRLPTVGLRAGEAAQWISDCRSTWAWPLVAGSTAVTVGFLVVALVGGSSGLGLVGFVGSVLAVSILAFTSIRVSADRRGLRVEYGPFPWPRTRVPLDAIVAAHTEADAIPTQWGGWGYRGSLWLTGRAAIVLRRGPALRLDLRHGRTLLVTVDDPATGAGVLNDLHRMAFG
jgi:hypothetical protein